MLLAHAITLAEARSYVAALADLARTFDASVEYERVLLQLDWIHGDEVPGISPVLIDQPRVLFTVAETAIEDLVDHGDRRCSRSSWSSTCWRSRVSKDPP